MGSWIYDGFLDSRWVPAYTIGSWIYHRYLDSGLVPGFMMGSSYQALHSTEIFGTARIIRARHRNIGHDMDRPHPSTPRHGIALHLAASDVLDPWVRLEERSPAACGNLIVNPVVNFIFWGKGETGTPPLPLSNNIFEQLDS